MDAIDCNCFKIIQEWEAASRGIGSYRMPPETRMRHSSHHALPAELLLGTRYPLCGSTGAANSRYLVGRFILPIFGLIRYAHKKLGRLKHNSEERWRVFVARPMKPAGPWRKFPLPPQQCKPSEKGRLHTHAKTGPFPHPPDPRLEQVNICDNIRELTRNLAGNKASNSVNSCTLSPWTTPVKCLRKLLCSRSTCACGLQFNRQCRSRNLSHG